jgi:hypothetical protein
MDGHNRRPRKITITVLSIVYTIVQAILFGVLIRVLPLINGFYVIWLCNPYGGATLLVWWLGIGAATATVVRSFLATRFFTGNEIFHLSSLPDKFRLRKCERCAVAKRKPPIQTAADHRHPRNLFSFVGELWALIRYDISVSSSSDLKLGGLT